MKSFYLSILFCIALYATLPIQGQNPSETTQISTCIPYERADDTSWLKRFQHDIDAYKQENARLTDRSCDVLFLGSSSINLWHNIYDDLAPLKIIRRSYGGSTLRDQIYNYDTVARGYKPRQIALYIENDLGHWPGAVGPGECYDLFRILIGMLRENYPEIPIHIISFKPAFAKMDQLADQRVVNALLQEYGGRTEGVSFIDITPPMYNEQGELREDLFIEDRLHINQQGYNLWTAILKPVLMEVMEP